MTDYSVLNSQLKALIGNVPHSIANFANASALLFQTLEDINWAGFYIMDNGKLILGPFQGKPACIEIPLGRGVCGTAAQQDETQVVDNVHLFPGHIACDSASNSEIVIPFHKGGIVAGVLDIDSQIYSRFSDDDRTGLEAFVRIIEEEFADR